MLEQLLKSVKIPTVQNSKWQTEVYTDHLITFQTYSFLLGIPITLGRLVRLPTKDIASQPINSNAAFKRLITRSRIS